MNRTIEGELRDIARDADLACQDLALTESRLRERASRDRDADQAWPAVQRVVEKLRWICSDLDAAADRAAGAREDDDQ